VGGYPATGELAGLISGDHQPGEVRWWPVSSGAVVHRATRGGVGENTPPGASGGEVAGSGDGSIAGEVAGELVSDQQRGVGNGDPDIHSATAPAPTALTPAAGLADGIHGVEVIADTI
jgi:hypothetical protein